MSMRGAQTWLAVMVAGVGLFVAALFGGFAYMSLTVTPLHPEPQEVPSAAYADPAPAWTRAAERGRQIARAAVSERNLPGLSVAVGTGGDIVWAEGFGWMDLESRAPVTPVTRFKIGTASKVLTSTAVGLLLQQGRLRLDDTIDVHVPDFPEKEWPFTLRQLMAHTAGVRTDGGDEGPFRTESCERTLEGLRLFADRSLLFEPGTQYRYSSYGWILVSAAIERAANEPFLRFMEQQIFKPLRMDDTAADEPTEPLPDRAAFYFPKFAGDPRYGEDGGARQVDYSCYAGAATFLSTPSDLVRYGMAIGGGTLLQPVTVQTLQTAQRLPSGAETGYGLGWDIEVVEMSGKQTRVVGHDGELMGGMVASLLTFPDGLVVAVTSNIAYADTFSLAVRIAQAFVEEAENRVRE